MEKLKWCGYTTMKISWNICLFISAEYMQRTDEWTDTHRTTTGHIYAKHHMAKIMLKIHWLCFFVDTL